jgi:subtilisin family serine protease
VPARRPRAVPRDREPSLTDRFSRMFAPPELYDEAKRREWQLGDTPGARGPYVIELNLQHIQGLAGAAAALEALYREVAPNAPSLVRIAHTYYRGEMTPREWQGLLAADGRRATEAATAESTPGVTVNPMQHRAIYKLWPDFPVKSQMYKSMPTIKADAALRSYDAAGRGVVWAVLDSGIDRAHPHFRTGATTLLDAPEVRDLHRSFVAVTGSFAGFATEGALLPDPDDAGLGPDERRARIDEHRAAALVDEFGHGTHVAGIIAGAAPVPADPAGPATVRALERVYRTDPSGESVSRDYDEVVHHDASAFHGVAPECRLISLRVLDAAGGGRSSDIIRALAYIRERLNDNPKMLRVHGVNLSVGYDFDAEMFACGQSPVCAEVNRLVQSGVVVVAAAGNTGYGTVGAQARATKVGLSNTINDPGNAELAITVGATHRDSPHTYGVSYFSSKGPTGDGRLKPDLVAPGERITSCATGARLAAALKSARQAAEPAASPRDATAAASASATAPAPAVAYYIEDSGTSMAAPHVSGAIAAFLSIRREFIGRPLEVKQVFTSSALPLGRERYFEGHGLVDLMRAIQSV